MLPSIAANGNDRVRAAKRLSAPCTHRTATVRQASRSVYSEDNDLSLSAPYCSNMALCTDSERTFATTW